MTPADLPPVTDEHRRSAFAAMNVWRITFEAAMRNPVWRQVIECAAARLRTRIYNSERNTSRRTSSAGCCCVSGQTVRRYDPATDTWHTQVIRPDVPAGLDAPFMAGLEGGAP